VDHSSQLAFITKMIVSSPFASALSSKECRNAPDLGWVSAGKGDRIAEISSSCRLSLIARIASDAVLESAFQWLCEHRAHYHFNADVWQVRRYYASIDHQILMEIVGRYVHDEVVLALLWGYCRRYLCAEGRYLDITQGISLGCPLSPLMGALFLKPLDDRMAELGCFYARYMDDWVVLAPTRWKLRTAIKAVNEEMARLRVVQHPDKTFIGRVARGFDFLGYWFSPSGFGIAHKTVERMVAKVSRLYEQGADEQRIETYLKRWWRWVKGGVKDLLLSGGCIVIQFLGLGQRRVLHP
jgi:hypothetical protein